MPPEVTRVNPRFGKRSWVKLWVNEWLDGTTRFEMTDAQRAFWIDLLAMAGRSRFPGRICAGQVEGVFIGYPLNKFQALMSEPIDIGATLDLFVKSGKIRLTVTQESPTKLVMLELVNWDKFQSEYQRQKKYRKRGLQPSDSRSDTQSNNTEVEVDSEVEVDTEREQRQRKGSTAPADRNLILCFQALGHKPFGDAKFQKIWAEEYAGAGSEPNWTDIMEVVIQRCQSLRVTVPGLFYKHKHEIEKGEVKMRYQVTPL
jgi:hypothetical protein